ncbi:hypothetical protein Tco_0707547 [Tanacetum coccineum]|uniref:Retrotransposon gag domain-containing protein n=1 Tax=Tanacetum coccineum TaxID=301880 RepID=A0ABQ4YBK1_9ASTR
MVINSPCLIDKKELAILGQTTTGKEFSNPLMAGSLPKTISPKRTITNLELTYTTTTTIMLVKLFASSQDPHQVFGAAAREYHRFRIQSSLGRFDVFLRDQLLVFQQHQDESFYDSWTRFKDIIRKFPNHDLTKGDLRKFSDIGAWVQVPRCMAWLDYDEHVDSLSTMDNEVGVTSPESTTQTLSLFKEYTPPVTYPKEVENTLGTPIEVEPLNETELEEVGLNCNHNTPFSSREVPSFDGPEPQLLPNISPLDVNLGD